VFPSRRKGLCYGDAPLTCAYFRETGRLSLLAVESRTSGAWATVGSDALAGIRLLPGVEQALGRYVVPVCGFALAIQAWRSRAQRE
jgi:hypothetical protein